MLRKQSKRLKEVCLGAHRLQKERIVFALIRNTMELKKQKYLVVNVTVGIVRPALAMTPGKQYQTIVSWLASSIVFVSQQH